MIERTYKRNLKGILIDLITLRFSMICEHAKYLLEAFDPAFNDIKQQLQNATDDDFYDVLGDDAAALNDLLNDTIPLILVRTYSSYEALLYKTISILVEKPYKQVNGKWRESIKHLSDIGIIWENLPYVNNINNLRLLVNCYKHNDSKANEELEKLLGVEKGQHVNWGEIEYKMYVESCKALLLDLANRIK